MPLFGAGCVRTFCAQNQFISGAILPAVLYCQPHVPRQLQQTQLIDFMQMQTQIQL